MTADTTTNDNKKDSEQHRPMTDIYVAPSPHLSDVSFTTRRMMTDVLVGLVPIVVMAVYFFHWYAILQVGLALSPA